MLPGEKLRCSFAEWWPDRVTSGWYPSAEVRIEAPRGVAVGRAHACAVLADGGVACWGANVGESLTADDADRAPRLVPLRR